MATPTRNGVQYTAMSGDGPLTANYPGGSSSGDLIVLFAHTSRLDTTSTSITPGGGGWTQVHQADHSANATAVGIWWKFRGGETSTSLAVSPNTVLHGIQAITVSYTGNTVDTNTPVATGAPNFNAASGGALAGPVLNVPYDESQLLHFFSGLRGANTAWTISWSAGPTEIGDSNTAWTAQTTARGAAAVAVENVNAGNSTARTATPSTNVLLRNFYTVAVAPPQGVYGADAVNLVGTDAASVTEDVAAPGPTQVGGSSATGTGTDLVINYPAGSVSGDYITAMAHFYKTTGTTAPTISTPSGWTLLETLTADGTDPYRVSLYGRFRSSETSVTFVANTGTDVQSIGTSYAYRNVDLGVPVTDSAITYELGTTPTHETPSVTTTSVQNRIWRAYIANGQYQSDTSVEWADSTEVIDTSVTIDSTRRVNCSAAVDYMPTIGARGVDVVTQAAPLVALSPRGMDKSGTFNHPTGNGTAKVTGWAPKSGSAAGDIVNDELIVNGAGNITVTLNATRSGTSGASSTFLIYRNGSQVATSGSLSFGTTGSATWTGDVVQGDSFAFYWNRATFTAQSCSTAELFYTVNGVSGDPVQFGSDTFDGTGALNSSNWDTTGGGTLARLSGELDGDNTPSVPLSYAWWKTPSPSETQTVKAKVRWNGRSPAHSACGVVLRANPSASLNGKQFGVQFAFTADIMALYYEDFGAPNGFVSATGTPSYASTSKFAEGAEVELRANGNLYTALVDGVIKLQGTISSAAIPFSNSTVGATIQNDELESGGGQPPGRLDDWLAFHIPPGGNGNVHYFGVAVALQVPQNIELDDDDDYNLTATETVASLTSADTDADDYNLTATEAATGIQFAPVADDYDLTAAEAVESQTSAQTVADDYDLTATEAVESQTSAQTVADDYDLTATETQVVSYTQVVSDGPIEIEDVNTGIAQNVADEINWDDSASPVIDLVGEGEELTGEETDVLVSNTIIDTDDYDLSATEDQVVGPQSQDEGSIDDYGVPIGIDVISTEDENNGIEIVAEADGLSGEESYVQVGNAIDGDDAWTLDTDEAEQVLPDVEGDAGSVDDEDATLAVNIDVTDSHNPTVDIATGTLVSGDTDEGEFDEAQAITVSTDDDTDLVPDEFGKIGNVWSVVDSGGLDTETQVVTAHSTDAVTVEAFEIAFRSSDGILEAPRLLTILPDRRRIAISGQDRTITVLPEVRKITVRLE